MQGRQGAAGQPSDYINASEISSGDYYLACSGEESASSPVGPATMLSAGKCRYSHAKIVHLTLVLVCLCPCRYLAAQGPCEDTTPLFWEMVWQRDVRVIVMLTRLVEG